LYLLLLHVGYCGTVAVWLCTDDVSILFLEAPLDLPQYFKYNYIGECYALVICHVLMSLSLVLAFGSIT